MFNGPYPFSLLIYCGKKKNKKFRLYLILEKQEGMKKYSKKIFDFIIFGCHVKNTKENQIYIKTN